MEFRRGILFIRLKGDLNKNTIKGVIDEDFKYVVLNLDNMYSIDSYSIKYINKIRKNIEYEDGKLTIAGDLQATTGTIGGWRITEDSIVSATNDLVLYSNGRIVGLGVSNDDDEFVDVGNKTISWK